MIRARLILTFRFHCHCTYIGIQKPGDSCANSFFPIPADDASGSE